MEKLGKPRQIQLEMSGLESMTLFIGSVLVGEGPGLMAMLTLRLRPKLRKSTTRLLKLKMPKTCLATCGVKRGSHSHSETFTKLKLMILTAIGLSKTMRDKWTISGRATKRLRATLEKACIRVNSRKLLKLDNLLRDKTPPQEDPETLSSIKRDRLHL